MRLTTLSLVVLALVAAQARQLHEEQHDGRALLQKASPAPRAVAAAVARPAPSPKPAAKKAKAQSPSPKPAQSLKPNKPLPQGTLLLTAAQQQQQASQLATRALTAGNSTAYPCAVGDAPCYCNWKNDVGYFADNDPTVACKSYYWCWSINPVQGAYYTCQTGLIFDQTLSVCNWPKSTANPGGTTCPAPSSSPSPTPATSPPPSPAVSPPPPATSPSPSPPPPATSPSPSPPPRASPLPSPPATSPPLSPAPGCGTDPTCFCSHKNATGMIADVNSGCTSYFWCVTSTQAYYKPCGDGLLFNDARQYCDWAANVVCTGAPPTSPSPSPTTSPGPPPPSPAASPAQPPSPPPPPSPPSPPPAPPGAYRYSGYYQTWSDPWTSNPATSRLATLPPYVNLVILAFMQPDCASYPGGITFQGTGIQFSSDAQVVNQSIAVLKKKNPNTKVVVAVGGATYTNWASLDATRVANFVKAFGLDGVDIDYEPASAGCSSSAAGVSCATDAEFERVIRALRAALPRPALLSAAAWSIGAYGQGAWLSSQPSGDHTGMSVNPLRRAGNLLDLLNVMSYDASNLYNVTEGYDAYRSLFPTGQILMGIEVPPEAWGGHVTSITEVNSICSYVKAHGGNGLMLWSLQKSGTPSAADISAAACTCLGLPSCGTRLAA